MLDLNAPVRLIPGDDPGAPVAGTGLCLSGGGYRAMLFHLGALWRLHELGWLGKLDRVSSVSGGSITAAMLGLTWPHLDNDPTAFELGVVAPLRALARRDVDAGAIAVGLLTPETVGRRLAEAYRRHLYADATLQDLPDSPRFIFCATNLASGQVFRFSKKELADWRVGSIPAPDTPLADAVAASSAFPPLLSPFELDLRDAVWQDGEASDLTGPAYRAAVKLSDGGVSDNLGLETVWKRNATVLVSDAGGAMRDDPKPPSDWVRQFTRVVMIVNNQVRDLRKRQIREGYERGDRDGAYWSVRSNIDQYELPDALPAPYERTLELANTPTRLAQLDDELQERLINWGYVVADTAMRKHVIPGTPPPAEMPYPETEL